MTLLAATAWKDNAELIAACAELGYLRADMRVLDATFGKGGWWKRWRPDYLGWIDSPTYDFRKIPCLDNEFDAVAYDPPYVCVGGRETSGLQEMYGRYGQLDAPKTPKDLQWLINDGLGECTRVLAPGGTLLVKCQDYISGGKLWLGVWETTLWAKLCDLQPVDIAYLVVQAPRPQPPGRKQRHFRRNVSTLLVFRKPK